MRHPLGQYFRSTGVFLIVAVSGVYLALRYEVFRPASALVLPISPDPFEQPAADPRALSNDPAMSYRAIVAMAGQEAERRGWEPQHRLA